MLFDRALYLTRVEHKRHNFQSDILFKFSQEIISDKLILIDEIFKFKPYDKLEVGPNTKFIDEEGLKLENNIYDCIISNLSFHFVNDIPGVLSNYLKALKNGGFLIMTFFGEENLLDFKNHFISQELKLRSGASLRFIPNITVKDAGRMLQRVGFKDIIASVDTFTIDYKTQYELITHLRKIAQSNCLVSRDKGYVPKEFLSAIKKQDTPFSTNYNLISILGRKA